MQWDCWPPSKQASQSADGYTESTYGLLRDSGNQPIEKENYRVNYNLSLFNKMMFLDLNQVCYWWLIYKYTNITIKLKLN